MRKPSLQSKLCALAFKGYEYKEEELPLLPIYSLIASHRFPEHY
jgi:hypothetical protein